MNKSTRDNEQRPPAGGKVLEMSAAVPRPGDVVAKILRSGAQALLAQALEALVGPRARGLSSSTISRLKQVWTQEYEEWSRRDLHGKPFVYLWIDGIYCQARLEEEKQCLLVAIGADAEGRKQLVGLTDGYRESEQSWLELLLDLKQRGLEAGPELAIGDGALGFWKALRKVYPQTRAQRCWVHKTRNVLDKLPKGGQKKAKAAMQAIWMAATKQEAESAFRHFQSAWEPKYPQEAECLARISHHGGWT